MSEKFLVPTYWLIKEYLEENELDLAWLNRLGDYREEAVSILRGWAPVTEKFASLLQELMPDIPAGYWLNYDKEYIEWHRETEGKDWYKNEV